MESISASMEEHVMETCVFALQIIPVNFVLKKNVSLVYVGIIGNILLSTV